MEVFHSYKYETSSIYSSLSQQFSEIQKERSSQSITKLVKIILTDLNLIKVVNKDLKSREIKVLQFEEGYENEITKIFLNTYEKEEDFKKIKEKLLDCAKINNPFQLYQEKVQDNIIDCLHLSFIKNSISKNCKIINQTIDLINFFESKISIENRDYISKLKNSLQVWALQYLSKGAKIPILEQKGPLQIPFFEYYGSNSLEYYRHDGGEIEQIIVDKLKKEVFKIEEENDNFFIKLTKLNTFSSLCEIVCKSEGYTCLKISSLNELKNAIHNIERNENKENSEKVFYDISELLWETDIKNIFTFELISACENNENIIFGGSQIIKGQECSFFSPDNMDFVSAFTLCRGALGCVTEISEIRHQLIKLGFSLSDLTQYLPTELKGEISLKGKESLEIENASISTALEKLEKVIHVFPEAKNTQVAQFYLNMYKQLLVSLLSRMKEDEELKPITCLQPLIDSFDALLKKMHYIVKIDGFKEMPLEKKNASNLIECQSCY